MVVEVCTTNGLLSFSGQHLGRSWARTRRTRSADEEGRGQEVHLEGLVRQGLFHLCQSFLYILWFFNKIASVLNLFVPIYS